jgi:hypothetical protein
VISVEVDERKALAEGLVMTLTGGDTVSARFLYNETFEFLAGVQAPGATSGQQRGLAFMPARGDRQES